MFSWGTSLCVRGPSHPVWGPRELLGDIKIYENDWNWINTCRQEDSRNTDNFNITGTMGTKSET